MTERKRPEHPTPTPAELAIRQSQETPTQQIIVEQLDTSETTGPYPEVGPTSLQTLLEHVPDEIQDTTPIDDKEKGKLLGAAEIIMRKRPKAGEIPLAGILRPPKKK